MGRRTANETKDEKLIEQGKRALRRSYYESIKSFSAEIIREAKERFDEDDEDERREWVDEQIHLTADGTSWVIYTHQALDVLVASENWLAIEDQGLGGEYGDDVAKFATSAAFWAFREDLTEEIQRQDSDILGKSFKAKRRKKGKGGNRKKNSRKSNPGLKTSLLR